MRRDSIEAFLFGDDLPDVSCIENSFSPVVKSTRQEKTPHNNGIAKNLHMLVQKIKSSIYSF